MEVGSQRTNVSVLRLETLAIVSGLIYLSLFTLPFSLTTYYYIRPPVDYTKLTNYSPVWFVAYVVGTIALFWLYGQAIRLAKPSSATLVSPRFVFATSAIFAAILIFSYPLTAIDLFVYAIRTRGWALYGLPPLITPPEALPATDPWLALAGEWLDAPSPYGPVWEWLSLGVFYLGGGNFLAHLFGLKLIGALAYLGCGWLVYQILQYLEPRWAVAGTMAFVWNPLVLLESVQNAHNDILMMLFLLGALWAYARLRPSSVQTSAGSAFTNAATLPLSGQLLICLLLALSILVKFVTLLAGPFILIAVSLSYPTVRQRLLSLTRLSLVTGGLIILPMLPVWPGWDNWAVLAAGSGAGRSLLALLVLALRDTLGVNTAFDLARPLILLIFGLIYLSQIWPLLQLLLHPTSPPTSSNLPPLHPSTPPPLPPLNLPTSNPLTLHPPNLPSFHPSILTILHPSILPSFHIFFWYVLLAAPVFHAWYLLWFAPLACLLLPYHRPLQATIVFSLTALLIIPYFETVRVWYPSLLQNHLVGHLIGVPLLLLPPALTLLRPTGSTATSEVSSAQH